MPILGCRRCPKTRPVKWYEITDYDKGKTTYLCRSCKTYETRLQHIEFENNELLKMDVNTTVAKSLGRIAKEIKLLLGD